MYQHTSLAGKSIDLPVGKVVCVGRNYLDHIQELNNEVPAEPLLFMKPATALCEISKPLVIPADRGECHNELEVALLIAQPLRDCSSEQTAADALYGVGLALDLTLRDVQQKLKDKGQPWERAKAFEQSAPLGPMTPLTEDIDLADLHFELTIDGQTRQAGHTANMMVGIAGLVAVVSRTWTLRPGDLIFTGTPEGVGPIAPGQQLRLSGPQFETASWAIETA